MTLPAAFRAWWATFSHFWPTPPKGSGAKKNQSLIEKISHPWFDLKHLGAFSAELWVSNLSSILSTNLTLGEIKTTQMQRDGPAANSAVLPCSSSLHPGALSGQVVPSLGEANRLLDHNQQCGRTQHAKNL